MGFVERFVVETKRVLMKWLHGGCFGLGVFYSGGPDGSGVLMYQKNVMRLRKQKKFLKTENDRFRSGSGMGKGTWQGSRQARIGFECSIVLGVQVETLLGQRGILRCCAWLIQDT